jgi:hypothetical protein
MRFRKTQNHDKVVSDIKNIAPDIVYITSDGPAIEILKRSKDIKAKIVVNAVGITTSHLFGIETYLQNSDAIICFSHKIKNKLKTKKTKFIKYGTDFEYFKYQKNKLNYVVCIGNDLHRDWGVINEVASLVPEIEFRIIGRSVDDMYFSSNNIKSLGNTDFLETKDVLMNASLCFVPTKNNDAFSGETTILNSLSCGTNVLFPNDSNLIGHEELKKYTYNRDISVADLARRLKMEVSSTISIDEYEKLKEIYSYDSFCNRLDSFFHSL